MFYDEGQCVKIEDEDQCITCDHFNKGVACPLMYALGAGVVCLAEDTVIVQNCGFYKEFVRSLRLIKGKGEQIDGSEEKK
jgi:hypothetical protein